MNVQLTEQRFGPGLRRAALSASRHMPSRGVGGRLVPLGGLLIVALLTYLANDWTVLPAVAILLIGWKFLSREPDAPVALAAFTYQWLQVTLAIFYFAITRRQVIEMQTGGYRPMVLLGLVSISVLFTGFYLAARFPRGKVQLRPIPSNLPPTMTQLVVLYVGSVAASGVLEQLAWTLPLLTQAVLVLSLVRYILLYFLVARLVKPRMRTGWIALILLAEVALGFAGFFATFREPIFVIAIALLSAFDRRKVSHWTMILAVAITALAAAVTWTAIKPIIRKSFVASRSTTQRISTAFALIGPTLDQSATGWKTQSDKMVSRMWAVYYPSLALARVPSMIPHENGRILWSAIENLLAPRLFFPTKGELPSDSEKVRRYSGVWVAGREIRTSYAFGYVAESYVDFGVPLMFVPIFLYGVGAGMAHRRLRRAIHHPELRTAVIVVLFWSSLYLFEVSWVIMIGWAVTRMIILGTGAVIADRFLLRHGRRWDRMRTAAFPQAQARMYGRSGEA